MPAHRRRSGGVPRSGAKLFLSLTLATTGLLAAGYASADVTLQDRHVETPLVIDQPTDYTLKNVYVSGIRDAAAVTIAGRVSSVSIENSKFGNVRAGGNGKAAALDAVGATVGTFTATDSAFYDAENQLVSLKDGSFGTVTFLHCTFKASDAFLKKVYADNPWRVQPPTMEFYNIDRLELLDNEFANTTIVIHPSVKLVIFRGDLSKIRLESPSTQVIRLGPADELPTRLAGTVGTNGADAAAATVTGPAADDTSAVTASERIEPDAPARQADVP